MPKSTSTPQPPHSPRAAAVRNAAQAVNAYQANPDTYTLHRMQSAVHTAQNLGASLTDIRNARTTAATQ